MPNIPSLRFSSKWIVWVVVANSLTFIAAESFAQQLNWAACLMDPRFLEKSERWRSSYEKIWQHWEANCLAHHKKALADKNYKPPQEALRQCGGGGLHNLFNDLPPDCLGSLTSNQFRLEKQKIESKAGAPKQVSSYTDETTITTSNSVGTIEVRAMSFGPGFCAVEIVGEPGRARLPLIAPPADWTDWRVLTSHTGAVSFKIKNEVKCDTGVRTEVRWSR